MDVQLNNKVSPTENLIEWKSYKTTSSHDETTGVQSEISRSHAQGSVEQAAPGHPCDPCCGMCEKRLEKSLITWVIFLWGFTASFSIAAVTFYFIPSPVTENIGYFFYGVFQCGSEFELPRLTAVVAVVVYLFALFFLTIAVIIRRLGSTIRRRLTLAIMYGLFPLFCVLVITSLTLSHLKCTEEKLVIVRVLYSILSTSIVLLGVILGSANIYCIKTHAADIQTLYTRA